MGKKSAITEINEIQGSSSETLTNAKDIADHLNKHFTQNGPDLAKKNSCYSCKRLRLLEARTVGLRIP